MQLNCL